MLRLSELALRQLIEGGETSTVELKVASSRPDEMAERLCGLANAKGGLLIIGIADETLELVGVPEKRIALTKDVALRAARQIKPELLLEPPEPETYVLDGKNLVVVIVPPNRGTIYQASGVFWVRRGTYTVPLAISDVMELAHDRGLVNWEKEIVREATILNKYVVVGAKIVGWKRIDLPEYPIEVLREAIVNAIVHRDYSRTGESR